MRIRWIYGMSAIGGLVLIFLFQGFDVAGLMGVQDTMARFIVNRSVRFLLNDLLAILLLYALFYERKYVLFAVIVQIVGMVFILVPYFILKINYPAYNGPLISYLHRLVLNPTLLLILIPAFYYQKNLTDARQLTDHKTTNS